MAISDELFRTSAILGNRRKELINQEIALQSSNLFSEWTERANTRLKQEELNSGETFGFADSQKTWYDNNLAEFLNTIEDERIKNNLIQATNRHKTSYSLQSEGIGIRKIKETQKLNFQKGADSNVGLIYATDAKDLDLVFDEQITTDLELRASGVIPELRDDYLAQIQPVYEAYFRRKLDDIETRSSLGLLSSKEYSSEVNNLKKVLNSDERFNNLNDIKRIQLNELLTGQVKSQGGSLRKLRESNGGLILENAFARTRQTGQGLSDIERTQITNAYAGSSKLQDKLQEIEKLDALTPFYRARSEGDIETMRELQQQAQDSVTSGNISASKSKIAGEVLSEINQAIGAFEKKIINNPLQALENNSAIALSRREFQVTGDSTNYLKTAYKEQIELGLPASSVTYLTDNEVNSFRNRLSFGATADQVQEVFKEVDTFYAKQIAPGVYADQSVLNQIGKVELVDGVNKNPLDQRLSVAFDYKDSPLANQIIEGAVSNYSQLKQEISKQDEELFSDIEKRVDSKLTSFYDSLSAQADESFTFHRSGYGKLATSMAARMILAGRDAAEAIDFATSSLMSKYKFVQPNSNQGNEIRIPTDIPELDPDLIASKLSTAADFGESLSFGFSETGLSKKDILEEVIYRAGGNLSLIDDNDDVSDLIGIPPEIAKEMRKDNLQITKRQLLSNSWLATSDDGLGLQLMTEYYLPGNAMPLIIKDLGVAEIPYLDIQDNRLGSKLGLEREFAE